MTENKFGVGDFLSETKDKSKAAEHSAHDTNNQESKKDIEQGKSKTLKTKKDNYINLQKQATSKDAFVGVNARVLREYRDHWAVEAKRQRTSVSEVIVEALLKKFGEPEDSLQ